MQATTATWVPGGRGSAPLSKLAAYCCALLRSWSVLLIGDLQACGAGEQCGRRGRASHGRGAWSTAAPRGSPLAADASPHGRGVGGFEIRAGPPLRDPDDSRFHQVKPAEEPGDLVVAAEGDLLAHLPGEYQLDPGGLLRLDVYGRLAERQVAARRHGFHELGSDSVRVVRIRDAVHDANQHDRDRLAEVQRVGRGAEDLSRVPQISVYVGSVARATRQQRTGVREHDRIVVHVHDPGLRGHPLRDLVRVVHRRDSRADVKELPDPGLRRQVAHRPAEERPMPAHALHEVGVRGERLIARLAVSLEVVLAAQPVVVDASDVRAAGVELGHLTSSPLPKTMPYDTTASRGLAGPRPSERRRRHRASVRHTLLFSCGNARSLSHVPDNGEVTCDDTGGSGDWARYWWCYGITPGAYRDAIRAA